MTDSEIYGNDPNLIDGADGVTERWLRESSLGDSVALNRLLVRYLPMLRAYVRARCGSVLRAYDSASDIAQSVCADVLQKLDGFEYRSEAEFRAWLARVARRKIVTRVRRLRAQRRDVKRLQRAASLGEGESIDALAGNIPGLGTPSEEASAAETAARIEAALQQMPPRMRDVVVHSRILGLTPTQIARESGESANTVAVRLSRALARLARELGRTDRR